MKKLWAFILCLVVFASFVNASSYNIEYSQIEDKIVVEESINNIHINKYVSEDITEEYKEGYYFVEKLVFNESYSEVKIIINLDVGFILEKEAIFPEGYKIKSDGQTIRVIWDLKDIEKDSVFAIFVKIKDTRENYDFILIILAIGILIAILSYFYFKKIKKLKPKENKTKRKRTNIREKIEEYLLPSEKEVINELKKETPRELWQKQLQIKTGFSKAKLSRVIGNLESRNLITKIPFGNTNKIKLK